MTNNLVFAKKIIVKLWERLSSRDDHRVIAAGKPLPQAEKNFCKSLEVSVAERYSIVKASNRGEQSMNQPVVIIGIGELGGVFAKAFLHAGYPVYPVTREMDIDEAAQKMPNPLLVLVAVAEKDFVSVMQSMPAPWRNCIGLLQNELLPRDWQSYNIDEPTVISVWFEKKKGMDFNVLIPSRVYGPQARVVADALAGIDIACEILPTADDLLYELVRKNVFVFTINIAGLVLPKGTTTADLWARHHDLALAVANEVIDVQEWLTGASFDRKRLIDGLIEGINGDLQHKCKGLILFLVHHLPGF